MEVLQSSESSIGNVCEPSVDELTPLQFKVTQLKRTEKPGTGRFDRFYESGIYSCVVCNQELFYSDQKYDSGCGWPAFFDCIGSKVDLQKDYQLIDGDFELMKAKPHLVRDEIVCSNCRSHLGHVFNTGPKPTGKRFCVNSASLVFRPTSEDVAIKDEGNVEPESDLDVCNRD